MRNISQKPAQQNIKPSARFQITRRYGALAPFLFLTLTESPPVNQGTKADISHLFNIWNEAIQSGDPEAVASLYDPVEGVLVPTLSKKVRTSTAGIKDYFKAFMSRHPKGRIVESHVSIIDEATAVHSGLYSFDLDNKTVPARFTFVYHRDSSGRWLILHHHSSLMPERT